MNIEINPLNGIMGAEIRGFDISKADNRTKEMLNDTISNFQVICIKDQQLNPERLVELSKMFGKPKKYFVTDETCDGFPEVIIVKNREKNDENKPKVFASHWHTDDSYIDKPATLTFIYPDVLPVDGGGGTDFINCYKIYDELSYDLKNKLSKLTAVHKWSSRRNVSEVAKLNNEQEKLTPPVEHPLIRTHPITKKKSLYINPNRIDHISGYTNEESDLLLDELYEFSFQEKFQYKHSYEKGDLVIWDNRCTMHKANSDYDINQLRVMHRVMLEGENVF